MVDFVQMSKVAKDDLVMIGDRPCKVVEVAIAKTGKHGLAKMFMVARDMETNKRVETVHQAADEIKIVGSAKVDMKVRALKCNAKGDHLSGKGHLDE